MSLKKVSDKLYFWHWALNEYVTNDSAELVTVRNFENYEFFAVQGDDGGWVGFEATSGALVTCFNSSYDSPAEVERMIEFFLHGQGKGNHAQSVEWLDDRIKMFIENHGGISPRYVEE